MFYYCRLFLSPSGEGLGMRYTLVKIEKAAIKNTAAFPDHENKTTSTFSFQLYTNVNSTLLLMKLVRSLPFSIPCESNARSNACFAILDLASSPSA